MSSQIFKSKMDKALLKAFLEKISIKTEKYYIINNTSFKKGIYNESILSFFETIRPHYHISKRKYLEKTLSYNNLCTVVRQICKFNNIMYNSQIIYDKSNYEIIYFIYL